MLSTCIVGAEIDKTTELGYSSTKKPLTLEERRTIGGNVEQILKSEKDAARAPRD
jgi:DOPA 4,5-dioxygenase